MEMIKLIYLNLNDVIVVFFISILVTIITIKFLFPCINRYVQDSSGPQKIHDGIVSRLGGLSIFITLLITNIFELDSSNKQLTLYLFTSIPIFFIGFIEDITQSIKPIFRLLGASLSACLVIGAFDIVITSTRAANGTLGSRLTRFIDM